jgi:hypothetical protein
MRNHHGDQISDDPLVRRMRRLLLVATMTELLVCLVLFLRGVTQAQQSILVLALSIQAGVLAGVGVQTGLFERLLAMAKAKTISAKKFKAAMGREPVQDELERCNCNLSGQLGHYGCGWCAEHNKPHFACPCMQRRMESERMTVIPLIYESDLPRPPLSNIVRVTVTLSVTDPTPGDMRARPAPEGSKPPEPMNEVELEIARADMKFLIEKEKENGDWDKWLKSQRTWDGRDGR